MARYIPDIALRALSCEQPIKVNTDALSLEDAEAVVSEIERRRVEAKTKPVPVKRPTGPRGVL